MPRRKDGYRHREKYHGVEIDLYSVDEKTLAEKVRAKKNEIDAGLSREGAKLTVKKWCDAWEQTYKKGVVSDAYYDDIVRKLRDIIYPEIGHKHIRDVKPMDLQSILNKHADKSKSTLTKIRSIMTEAFRQAVVEGHISTNPAVGIKIPTKDDDFEDTSSHRALTDEEEKLFLAVCDNHYAGMWAKMLYYCGIRPQESATLKWGDIDYKNRLLKVRSALKRTGKIGKPKTKAGIRDIPIDKNFFEELIAKRPPDATDDDYIFTSNKSPRGKVGGKMLNHKTMRRHWLSLKRSMDIAAGAIVKDGKIVESKLAPDLQLYCLRHTYCTHLLRAGVPINTAKYLMGHNDLRMVSKVYGHHTSDQTDKAQELLEAFREKAKTGTNTGTEGEKC